MTKEFKITSNFLVENMIIVKNYQVLISSCCV